MTTESTETSENNESTSGTAASAGTSILDAIKTLVDGSGPEVRERVIAGFAEEKKAARVKTLSSAVTKLMELRSSFQKLNKADQISYDGSGKKIETMSAAKFDEIKKARESIERIEKAINLAVDKNDFSKLTEIVGK